MTTHTAMSDFLLPMKHRVIYGGEGPLVIKSVYCIAWYIMAPWLKTSITVPYVKYDKAYN